MFACKVHDPSIPPPLMAMIAIVRSDETENVNLLSVEFQIPKVWSGQVMIRLSSTKTTSEVLVPLDQTASSMTQVLPRGDWVDGSRKKVQTRLEVPSTEIESKYHSSCAVEFMFPNRALSSEVSGLRSMLTEPLTLS